MIEKLTCLNVTLGLILLVPHALSAQESLADGITGAVTPASASKATPLQYSADELDTSWNHDGGDIITRFAVDLTAVAGLEEGEFSVSDSVILGLSAGGGYYPSSRISADLDLSTAIEFAEEGTELSQLALTPGTHIYPIPQAFVRIGLPFVLTSPSSINGLIGAGYEIPVGENTNLVGEVDVVYPFTGDGSGTITVGGGSTYSF